MRPAAIVALLLSFPVTGLAIAASAQAPAPPSTQLDAMKKLDWMVGQWKGEARIEFAPGQQRTLTQTETVQSKLGGLVLLIEGAGTMKLPGREEEVPVFGALTVVSYDGKAKRYCWLAHTSGGEFTDAETKLTDGAFEWKFRAVQAGEFRYTFRRTGAGEWHEIGERSSDGKSWQKFFEMTLRRVNEAPAR
jgi:Protein of unknown function (DUF1579)